MSLHELVDRMITDQLEARGIDDGRVLGAMRQVPRHHFLPQTSFAEAYADQAMPTLNGQTISQPYIVARMSELLTVEPGDRVLEVGTGSGYQAAILLAMGGHVVGIEQDSDLASQAAQTVNALELAEPTGELRMLTGDGTRGAPDLAPFDRVLVTAAAPDLPGPLAEQLVDPGRAVVPIGDRRQQVLTILDQQAGAWSRSEDTPCRFVPLLGEFGFERDAGGNE